MSNTKNDVIRGYELRFSEFEQKLHDLRAERDRLREALEKIMEVSGTSTLHHEIARQALGEK